MSKEISHGDLGYDFKGPTASINFGKYGGPMYIYGHMKMVKKRYNKQRKSKKNFKKI